MIRRPPRSTPFPTRRSSDLGVRSTQHYSHVRNTTGWSVPEASPAVSDSVGYPVQPIPSRAVPNLGRSLDRKSTRLNSSHANISYAVFCLKKKKKIILNVEHN